MSDLKSIVRFGVVSAVYPQRHSCRLTFPDKDNLVSAEMPILIPAGAKNSYYSLPDVGDECVCICPNNDDSNGGFVLGSFYHDNAPPPTDNPNVAMIRFEDGTTLSYDRSRHELRVDVKGNIKINGKRVDIN